MAELDVDVLLVGGGVACASAAQTLVEEGFTGSALLVAREPEPPYERPPITKGYLRGEEQRADSYSPSAGWFDEAPIELRTRTTVTKLDSEAREATLSSGEGVRFGQALLATGANVRRLRVPGTELEGLHYLRVFGNADAVRDELDGVTDVVCVGGSFIGCEAGASLAQLGKRVTILMQEHEPLERVFGKRFAEWTRAVLDEHGVEVVGDDEVERFAGDGRVERVVTRGGRELPAQLVVCGVGVTPDVALARGAGLAIGESGGVRCDERLRTGTAGIWAAGDVCEYASVAHGGARIRVEHVEHAKAQGSYAARDMLGRAAGPYEEVPYFYSDLADWVSLEYVGPAREWDEEVVEGDMAGGRFGVWYLQDGRVRAALSVAGGLDLDRARELITTGGRPAAA